MIEENSFKKIPNYFKKVIIISIILVILVLIIIFVYFDLNKTTTSKNNSNESFFNDSLKYNYDYYDNKSENYTINKTEPRFVSTGGGGSSGGGGSDVSNPESPCIPKTCNSPEYLGECGIFEDGCSGIIECSCYNLINITNCSELNISNSIYILQKDLITDITCINITQNDIIFNGNGYSIEGDGIGFDYGVYVEGRNNVTVKNIRNITNFGNIFGGGGGGGILLNNTNNTFISNLNISSNKYYGITIKSSNNNSLDQIVLDSNYYGVHVINGHNNKIRNSYINYSKRDGIYISSSSNNEIYDITSNLNINEITIVSSYNNKISNISCFYPSPLSYSTIIRIFESSNNTFANIFSSNPSGYGIYLDSNSQPSDNNFFRDINISNTFTQSIYIKTEGIGSRSLNNTYLNVSYTLPEAILREVDGGDIEIIRGWYYSCFINDSDGNNISNASMAFYNDSFEKELEFFSDLDGKIEKQNLISYIISNEIKTIKNYNISIYRENYESINKTFNISQNLEESYTLEFISIPNLSPFSKLFEWIKNILS